MEREVLPHWSLTDEEWCELCFLVVELGEAHQRLQAALLAAERPSLNELWVSGNAFQQQSHKVFNYIGRQLRERALAGERLAA